MVSARGAHVITSSTLGTGNVRTGALHRPCLPAKPGSPFILVPPVLDKLRCIHDTIAAG
jgi:hypothetical protein